MLWEPHQSNFTTWQLASGKAKSTTVTRAHWIQYLARAYPQESALTITDEQVIKWLANPNWKPATRKSALQSIHLFSVISSPPKPEKTILHTSYPLYRSPGTIPELSPQK